MSDSFSTQANVQYTYGAAGDEVFVGDWNGDGKDTLAIRRGATFLIRNSNTPGTADKVITYGRPGDVVLVGDWDGNGTDTFAVRRGAQYFIKNSMTGGPADKTVVYGRAGDVVLVGDWDGNGTDTLAVRRGAQYFIKNSMTGGPADKTVVYGRSGDDVYVGDWDGDGKDTLMVRRGAQYFIKNSMTPGAADKTVIYGRTTDTTLVGDWNGDRIDSLGVRRVAGPPAPPAGTRTYAGRGDDVVDINTGGRPVLLTISCTSCASNFIVTTNGDDYLLVNEIGSYRGRHVIDMTGRTTILQIQADASWTILQQPLSVVYGEARRSGTGDDVVYLPSGTSRAAFTHNGSSNFIVVAYDPGWDLLVNEIGAYSGTVLAPTPSVVQIQADGAWTIRAY